MDVFFPFHERSQGRFVLSDRMNPLPLAPDRHAPSRPLDKNRLTGMLLLEPRCTATDEKVRWRGHGWDTEDDASTRRKCDRDADRRADDSDWAW